jgi:elongation factor Ts
VATRGNVGAVVEINAETDFVARNEQFQGFVGTVAELALDAGETVDALKAATMPAGGTVEEGLKALIGTIGENMDLRRSATISVSSGVVAAYVHNATAPGLGRIGVLVGLESTGDEGKLGEFGRQLAMHIAAAAPQWTNVEDVDQSALDRERDVLSEQARASGKPEDIVAKMVEGRLRKYYEEVVLLDQTFVIDNESRVRKAVETLGKELGAPVKVIGFQRFVLGEGVEKEDADFAAEVAAAAKG